MAASSLFFTFYKQLAQKNAEVVLELKNDLQIQGNLKSVDANLNIVLSASKVLNPDEFPHILSIRNMYVRGNLIRYIRMKEQAVDLELVRSLCLKEIKKETKNA